VVAVANQKGGVGKTTTAVSLSACLAERGMAVLVVDMDPQGNASTGLGLDPRSRRVTTYEVLTGAARLEEAILSSVVPGLSVVPATIDLAGAEVELVNELARESRIVRAVAEVLDRFDVVFLDCPPSLGLLTINAMSAAEELLVPIQCEYLALEGLGLLLNNASLIRDNVNPKLSVTGIVLTMFDPRVRLAEQVVADVRAHFGPLVHDTVIPRAVRLAEAPGFGMPITMYDPGSRASATYRALASEFLARDPRLSSQLRGPAGGAVASDRNHERVGAAPKAKDHGGSVTDVREDTTGERTRVMSAEAIAGGGRT
jgi:chromosome partitioning protein